MLRALIYIQILMCLVAYLIPAVPGWKMFANFQRSRMQMRYEGGKTIQHERFLPPITYAFSDRDMRELAKFVCQKDQAADDILLESNGVVNARMSQADCQWLPKPLGQ